ncbi:MAG: hydantoinase/oxoprolinase family protein [Paracoccaceae bacterium]|nr:hydantoinase/oxoprolinase family protein [Paracoccaceae bacterium]
MNNPTKFSNRLGVDIGGTFTDIVLETNSKRFSAKVLTDNANPEMAIFKGIDDVCLKADIAPSDLTQIIHGTTLATNSLIERKGAKTALITTEGFRDVIEMRTESRFEQYDLNLSLPDPLLSREHRYVLKERIDAQGRVLIPIEQRAVEDLANELRNKGYTSVAVGFLHSYVNNNHENVVGKIIQNVIPNIMVSLSNEVSPQVREYERFSTTVANAYIKPLIEKYLLNFLTELEKKNINCPAFLMHSGGGIMSFQDAIKFPVRLVESGPAGGAMFAADLASRYGLKKILSFDMGGTTAKICLIDDYKPKTSRVFEVARTYRFKKGSGIPISIPVIDMVEIGAGGGSLANVDSLNQIRVGPKSAGSDPGPACFNKGGKNVTVTDADLLLGKLDPKNFAGGSIELNPSFSKTVAEKDIGQNLQMGSNEAAWGVSEVVDENMANAARVHAIENGQDLSDYTMIAFGGAAPLHASRLCEKIGINRCIIPKGAGVGSAIGFLKAPYSFEASRSIFMRLSQFDADLAEKIFVDMEKEASNFVRSCDENSQLISNFKVYMRYSGQGWEIPISFLRKEIKNPSKEVFQKRFEEDYKKLFGRAVFGMQIEIVVWAVNTFTPLPEVKAEPELVEIKKIETKNNCNFFDTGLGKNVQAIRINRDEINKKSWLKGPAIISEKETATIVSSNFSILVREDECLDIRLNLQENNFSNFSQSKRGCDE